MNSFANLISGRVGGGSHSGSHSSSHGSSPGHSGTFHSSGNGSLSPGGLIALLLIGLLIWYVYRRISAQGAARPGASHTSITPEARQAIATVIGGALGAGLGARAGTTPEHSATGFLRPGLPAEIEAIRARDPGFEIETFLQRAEMTFFLVKRGLTRNDAESIRPYLQDELFNTVSRGIAEQKANHRHALLESLNVRAVHLLAATIDEQRQTLRIHFDLVYRAKSLDDANRVLSDEREDTSHGEQWTFMRAAAARTPASGDVTAARCPACGAELRLNLDGTCAHCRASVTNGSVDWVVCAVEPASFLGIPNDSPIVLGATSFTQGIANLKAADPAFSMDAFRTRVRTAFLSLQDAWSKQNLDAGRAFLSPGAYFAWSAQIEAMKSEGRRNVMEHLEIRQIEPIRVIHGRVYDDLTVRITAACADYEVDAGGKVVFGDRSVQPFTEEWTFQRSVGTTTTGKPGTLENTCPSCGAPVSLTQIGECRYCKAAVTSGKFDWVVSRIEQEDSGSDDGSGETLGQQIAMQVGGAIVGGLLGSLLSGGGSRDRQ